ncbi:Endoribonuclease L-PSP, partial [mine drainage metagenome]
MLTEEGKGKLESTVFEAYSTIFDRLDCEDYPQLLRVWNYFPGINDMGSELERYREFNVGRYEAFFHKNRTVCGGSMPAACALGTKKGGLVICFLASKVPGISLENPRQTHAYSYPKDFGPRSPIFSRGVLLDDSLLISGTASIIGSETA